LDDANVTGKARKDLKRTNFVQNTEETGIFTAIEQSRGTRDTTTSVIVRGWVLNWETGNGDDGERTPFDWGKRFLQSGACGITP
jgi:hypothetical protein